MFIKADKKIIGRKVVTQSGRGLGRVVDFETDASDFIIKYHVRGFLKESLIIDASQVIEIKKDKIIVEDARISAPDIEYAQ